MRLNTGFIFLACCFILSYTAAHGVSTVELHLTSWLQFKLIIKFQILPSLVVKFFSCHLLLLLSVDTDLNLHQASHLLACASIACIKSKEEGNVFRSICDNVKFDNLSETDNKVVRSYQSTLALQFFHKEVMLSFSGMLKNRNFEYYDNYLRIN